VVQVAQAVQPVPVAQVAQAVRLVPAALHGPLPQPAHLAAA
jgi:hypothetical protein